MATTAGLPALVGIDRIVTAAGLVGGPALLALSCGRGHGWHVAATVQAGRRKLIAPWRSRGVLVSRLCRQRRRRSRATSSRSR